MSGGDLQVLRERYSDLPIARALVQLIPYAGGSIDTLIAGRASMIRLRRIEHLFEELRKEMERLTEAGLDQEYLPSEEFDHLVMLAIEKAARTRQEEKIRYYARVLSRSVQSVWPDQPDVVEELLNTIAELSPTEFTVMQAMWDEVQSHVRDEVIFQAGDGAKAGLGLDVDALAARLSQFKKAVVIGYVARLQRTGIVVADTQGYFDSMGGNFSITPLFEQLMRLLADRVGEPPEGL